MLKMKWNIFHKQPNTSVHIVQNNILLNIANMYWTWTYTHTHTQKLGENKWWKIYKKNIYIL